MNYMNEITKMGLTCEQYEECLQLIVDKKNNVTDLDWQEICDIYHLPLTKDSLRRLNNGIFGGGFVADYLKNKNGQETDRQASLHSELGNKVRYQNKSEVGITKEGNYTSTKLIEMNDVQAKDPDYILNAHGFDPENWKLISARNNIRQVISKADGVVTLYASFITVKPIAETELPLNKIANFFDSLDRNYSLPQLNKRTDYLRGNKMLLIDIADLHMNLQTSMFTTGNEYNCDIAEELFFHVIEDVLSRTENYQFEEITFIIGGDMLNSDGLTGTTTKGTPQVNDVHFYDAYERLCSMTIKAIDILRNKCPVNVIYVPGNHDELTGFKLAKYIDAWFRDDDDIHVDYQPTMRKYKLYGKTLLCFAHNGKVQKLPAIIADEARHLWGQADMIEVFLQHLHTEQVLMEDNNIRIQRLPTISARSKWSTDHGYNARRQCKSFIFDHEDGLTDIIYTAIH